MILLSLSLSVQDIKTDTHQPHTHQPHTDEPLLDTDEPLLVKKKKQEFARRGMLGGEYA